MSHVSFLAISYNMFIVTNCLKNDNLKLIVNISKVFSVTPQ